MRPAAPALAAALWLAGGAASAAEPSRVSVEVLKEQLGRFDDRRVRVRGVLDECNGVVCHICPNWQARDVRDQCLELGDWKRGQSRRLDERFRYSEVVLTAVAHDRSRAALDPHAGLMHCVGSRDCNGELLNVEVEAVLERRAATDTQVLSNAKQPLLEPSAREDQVMREAFTSQLTPPHQMLVLRARARRHSSIRNGTASPGAGSASRSPATAGR